MVDYDSLSSPCNKNIEKVEITLLISEPITWLLLQLRRSHNASLISTVCIKWLDQPVCMQPW